MPQGDKRGNGWEFFDATYDGHWDGELQRGLGQLTDGKTGLDNFKMGYYDNDRSGPGMGRMEERHARTAGRDQVRVRQGQGVLGHTYLLQQPVH